MTCINERAENQKHSLDSLVYQTLEPKKKFSKVTHIYMFKTLDWGLD